jgi:hypothetical protein
MRTIEDLEFLNGLPVEKKFPTPKPESLEDNEEDVIQEASREEDEIDSNTFDEEDEDDLERANHIDPDLNLNIDVNGAYQDVHYETGQYDFQTTDRSRQSNRLASNDMQNKMRSTSLESESEFRRGGMDDEAHTMQNVKQRIEDKMQEGVEDVYIDAT